MSESGQKIGRGIWAWWAGEDDERCTVGPCGSRAQVIAAAIKAGLGHPYGGPVVPAEPQVFQILEGIQAPIDLAFMFCADDAINAMCERIDENHGDPDGDALTDRAWTPEQQKDLEARLTKTVRAWQADHRIVVLPYLFTETRNAERVEISTPSSSPPPPRPVLGPAAGREPERVRG